MSGQDQSWFESWFDSHYYHILYKHRDHVEAESFLSALGDKYGFESGRAWDMACGKGRHARYLTARGLDVIGSDLSPESIEEAAKSSGPRLQFYVHDMRLPIRVNYFDYVLNLFTSFGYFESDRENMHVLTSAYKALKGNGLFILDYLNAYRVNKDLVPEQYIEIEGVNFTIRKEIKDGAVLKRIDVNDNDDTHAFLEKVKLYKETKVEEMLKEAGFRIKSVYGSYKLEPYTEHSDRMIFIAEK